MLGEGRGHRDSQGSETEDTSHQSSRHIGDVGLKHQTRKFPRVCFNEPDVFKTPSPNSMYIRKEKSCVSR